MKLIASLVVLTASTFGQWSLAQSPVQRAPAHAISANAITGVWQGTATLRGQQIPATLRISGSGSALKVAFLNGPAEHPDESRSSSASFDGTRLIGSYDYYARKLDVALADGKLIGSFGSTSSAGTSTPLAVSLARVAKLTDPAAVANAPNIRGRWEIVTHSEKGEAAWEFRVDPTVAKSPVIKAVIQRIDGDTGGLWGTWNGTSYTVSHLAAAGAALWSVTPQPDGTLVLKNLIAVVDPGAPPAADLVARRTADARKRNLPKPTDPTQQTSMKDPTVPLAFSFPDLSGKTVANTDAQFRGKVVIVAIGGSWCPNCHDEAPFLVSLYRKYHAKGLEIVDLDFEEGDDPATDTVRLRAFIAHYGIPYPVLTAGVTDDLNKKIPQGVNLNCWPTSFFVGRDGLVKEVHAGFAGPGNAAGHEALVRETTALVEKLLAEPAGRESAKR